MAISELPFSHMTLFSRSNFLIFGKTWAAVGEKESNMRKIQREKEREERGAGREREKETEREAFITLVIP